MIPFARPESMGYIHKPSDLSPPKGFIAEYKYNGWAVGISRDKVITRHGKPLPPHAIDPAKKNIEDLRNRIDWDFCSMVHAELMGITSRACPVDTLIVHDCMGEYSSECFHYDRQSLMWLGAAPHVFHAGDLIKPIDQCGSWEGSGGIWKPKRVRFYSSDPTYYAKTHESALHEMMEFNSACDHKFYEGFVYKRISAQYGAKNAWFKQRIQYQLLKMEELTNV